jgi:acyl-coenzyme A synthetase/AMP-(fatty) acid ligase
LSGAACVPDQEVSTAFDVPELPKTASGKVQRFLLRAGA